jgi:hypothetical protein
MSVKITSTGGISALGGLSSTQVNNYFACNVGIGVNRPSYGLSLPDDCRIGIGDGGDLQLQHSSGSSYIENSTGHLYINNHEADKDIFFRNDNGSGTATTYFFLDGSAVDTRVCKNFRFINNVRAGFGTSMNFNICHDGTNSYLEETAGDLLIKNTADDIKILAEDDIVIRDIDDSTEMAKFINGGAVELYYNGSKKFETTCVGVKATGAICGTGNLDIDGHSTLMGNLSVRGTVTCIDTRIETTSAIEVQNAGTGPAILANQLGSQPIVDFQDDGTSSFYIEDGGNVGIGCTNPTEKLEVAGNIIAKDGGVLAGLNGDKDGFIFHDLYSGGNYWGYKAFTGGNSRMSIVTDCAERLTVNGNGCVGIGSNTPNQKLTVSGNISALGALSATSNITIERPGTTGRSELVIKGKGNSSGDHVGMVAFKSYSEGDPLASIKAIRHNADDKGCMAFATSDSEAMRIDNSGCVGIATACPQSLLHVAGGDIRIDNNRRYQTETASGGVIDAVKMDSSDNLVIGDCNIKIDVSGTSPKMTIGTDSCACGYVGIGNDGTGCVLTPNERLTVGGSVSASGNGYFACVVAGGYFEQKAANDTLASYPTGTLVVIGCTGDLVQSTRKNDRKVFGVTQSGVCQPIVLGAEPVLVTGDINIGDYITTSDKPGHGKSTREPIYGSVIAQSMESGTGDSHLVKAMIRKM